MQKSEEMEFAAGDYSLPFANSQRGEMEGKLEEGTRKWSPRKLEQQDKSLF